MDGHCSIVNSQCIVCESLTRTGHGQDLWGWFHCGPQQGFWSSCHSLQTEEWEGERTWDMEKGREEKGTSLHGNNKMPLRKPYMSDSLNVMLVLSFERIWVMSKHITQQKHTATSMKNHTLSILYNRGHNVTHHRAVTLLSSSALCQLPLGFYNLYDGKQNHHHW